MDFAQYWQYTDIVTKCLFFILIALSLVSWFVGITRLVQSKRLMATTQSDLSRQIQAKQGIIAGLPSDQQKTVVEQTLLQQINRFRFDSEKGLSVLGTTAAIAPFIGLFGTVWGIFHALDSIAKSGQSGLSQVAGPVGEALVMTGLGLAVAIPAVVFYNIAVRMNRKALHLANDTAHELLANTVIQ
ncbi:MotA/TolQ/ExbB proton channel family protein [Faucicola atlantae]|uniref:Biopolymer transport protein ExbB n=1 Tax=Faucicola atlantae TaxID=34059 RepID=A0A1B8QCS7_9GAMM|nr:MotA/TolQ/ExbB proton channel family protein [Moraxella atlantae]OBX79107.1 biopolymer transporter ExbB [Moraxella atlantae]